MEVSQVGMCRSEHGGKSCVWVRSEHGGKSRVWVRSEHGGKSNRHVYGLGVSMEVSQIGMCMG